jgi:hypothetical protein
MSNLHFDELDDKTIKLMNDAGITPVKHAYSFNAAINRLVAVVRADEREACAVVCENFTKQVNGMMYPFNGQTAETNFVNSISNIVAKTFAESIRARGEQ